MQTPGTPHADRSSTPARRLVVVFAAVAVIALAGTLVVAVAGRGPGGTIPSSPVVSLSPSATPSGVAVTHTVATPTPVESSPAASPMPVDPYALADGTYPTYITGVDVEGATITVDVVQLFKHHDAFRAAVQDGMKHHDARYLTVYLRNENDLLRTLPVAPDVKIHFMGTCDVPPNRHVALTQLKEATTPFDTTFYYEVTLRDSEVSWISQHLAIPAC